MTDELPDRSFSAFWPVLIFLIASACLYSYGIFQLQQQRDQINKQLLTIQVSGNLEKAKQAEDQLVSLYNDLKKTAATDDNAKLIINRIHQTGLIEERQNGAVAPGTNAAPSTSTNTP